MYEYYRKVNKEEHMLFAKEIAIKYGIYTVNNLPHSRLISHILMEIRLHTADCEQLYYSTRNGLAKVYPAYIYKQVKKYLNEYSYKENDRMVYMNGYGKNDKSYYIIKKGEI
ncbi:MAG: hypothetical protein LIR50_15025 [Bacillota bacterium]|nr:hypothetical protein [Bacillota bacterium]